VRHRLLFRPYLISTLLHLLILFLLALWNIRIENPQRWYQFEWLSEANLGAMPGTQENELSSDEAPVQEDSATPAMPQIETPILQSPLWEATESRAPIADAGEINQKLSRRLQDAAPVAGQNSAGYSSQLLEGGGDAYFIKETSPDITPLMDDSVIVEFRLSRDGSVIMNDLKVISYRRAEHWHALREAMKAWRFGFNKAYDPSRLYRIRCNFVLE
jgi:hypothetical protein